jgi:hypothetical protein
VLSLVKWQSNHGFDLITFFVTLIAQKIEQSTRQSGFARTKVTGQAGVLPTRFARTAQFQHARAIRGADP